MTCEWCEEQAAEVKVLVARLDGSILDTWTVCGDCAAGSLWNRNRIRVLLGQAPVLTRPRQAGLSSLSAIIIGLAIALTLPIATSLIRGDLDHTIARLNATTSALVHAASPR